MKRTNKSRTRACALPGQTPTARSNEPTAAVPVEYFISGLPAACGTDTDLPVGVTFDRFQVRQRLGGVRGCSVYLARDLVLDTDVVLKAAPLGLDMADRAASCLRHEAQVHAQIVDHRHVIRAHDLHVLRAGAAEWLVLSMEYADGGTLRDWLIAQRHDPARRRAVGLDYFGDACLGVAALHDAGLLHLDIKPENLAFVRGVLKLLDLGISITMNPQRSGAHLPIVEPSTWQGTAEYASPELLAGGRPDLSDQRSDIYSLGVILFEMLEQHCRLPFTGLPKQLRDLHSTGALPPLAAVDPRLAAVASRCLKKNPAERYRDVAALLAGLDDYRQGTPPNPKTPKELWNSARALMQKRNFNDAMRVCAELLKAYPDHPEARTTLKTLEGYYAHAERLYETVNRHMNERGLSEFLPLLEEANSVFPDHPASTATNTQFLSAMQRYLNQVDEGIDLLRMYSWQGALAYLSKAQRADPEARELAPLVKLMSRVLSNYEGGIDQRDSTARYRDENKARVLAARLENYVERIRVRVDQLRGAD